MTQWGLDTLFNPAKQHMDEEKRRLQSTREEIGDASGGRRIDLDSGKVRIPRKSAAVDAADTAETAEVAETAEIADAAGAAETAETAVQSADVVDAGNVPDGTGKK